MKLDYHTFEIILSDALAGTPSDQAVTRAELRAAVHLGRDFSQLSETLGAPSFAAVSSHSFYANHSPGSLCGDAPFAEGWLGANPSNGAS